MSYTERMQQYFVANAVEEDRQRAMLLSTCGPPTYQLMKDLVAPEKPTQKTFKELVELVEAHKNQQPSIIVRRFHFHSRAQSETETIPQYVAILRRLSKHCNFGDTLGDMLRDRLVCGLRDTGLQRRLLAEKDLTFQRAFDIGQAYEVAELVAIAKMQSLQDRERCCKCGRFHQSRECPFRNAECFTCGKRGHLAKVCRSKLRNKPRHANVVEGVEDVTENTYMLFNLPSRRAPPIVLSVVINGQQLPMELDTGASVSLITERVWRMMEPSSPVLQPSSIKLRTYTGEKIGCIGEISVSVSYNLQQHSCQFLVVKGDGPCLLGRDWLQRFKVPWQEVFYTTGCGATVNRMVEEVLDKSQSLFCDELGKASQRGAQLNVAADAKPIFLKAHPVPYALRERTEQELQRLERLGVIVPVESAEWAAPVVPVVKADGSVRICGDFRLTVNKALTPNVYPLPRIEDLFAALKGGQEFTKLDVAHAYLQIPIAEASQKYVTINTHRGLFRYTRLPFGVSAAPAIFQRTMENILKGIPGVAVYIDDILVTGGSREDHLSTLNAVLERLEVAGLKLKKSKCAFLAPSVEYLGHVISAEGLHPSEEKVRAIKEAPSPTNVS